MRGPQAGGTGGGPGQQGSEAASQYRDRTQREWGTSGHPAGVGRGWGLSTQNPGSGRGCHDSLPCAENFTRATSGVGLAFSPGGPEPPNLGSHKSGSL